jgi:biopolymer transport protein ExbB
MFLERLWALQPAKVLPRAFVDRVRALVSKRKLSEALVLCEENRSHVAFLIAAALRAHMAGKDRPGIKELVDEAGTREVADLERNVELVGTVATISPLLGLLGTVVGMIQVFKNFVEAYQQGHVGPDTFAAGIWQALITTAYGLIVAVPMLLFHRFLQGINDRWIVGMEEEVMGVVDLLEDGKDSERKAEEPKKAEKRAKEEKKDEPAEEDA